MGVMANPKDDKFNIKDFLKSKLRWEDFLNGNVQKKYKPESAFWVFWGLFQMLVISLYWAALYGISGITLVG